MYYYVQLANTLKYILKDISYALLKKYVVMKEKVHKDNTKVAKTRSTMYYAEWNDYILQIHKGQNDHQLSITDFEYSVLDNLSGDWLQTFVNKLFAAFIGKIT